MPQAPDSNEDAAYPHWRRNRRVAAFCTFCSTAGFSTPFAFVPLILAELGSHARIETLVGALMLGFYVVTTASTPVWGALADHYGRKLMVLRAGYGLTLAFGLMALAPGLGWFVPLFVLAGLANGFVPASLTLVATNTPKQHSGSAIAAVQSGTLLGGTLGPAMGAGLATALPRAQDLYWVSTALLFVASTGVLLFVREAHRPQAGRFELHLWRDTRQLLRLRGMPLLMGVAFVFAVTFSGSTAIASLFALEMLGPRGSFLGLRVERWLGIVTLALTLSSAVALPFWGRLLDRLEASRGLLLVLSLGAAASWLVPASQNPLHFTLARVALGLAGCGVLPAVIRLVRDRAPQSMEARAMALQTAVQFLSMGAAPFAAGFVGPAFGLRSYFALNALLFTGAALAWAWRTRRP